MISLPILQAWKLRQRDSMLFVQSHKTLNHGLIRHFTQSVNETQGVLSIELVRVTCS